MASPNSTGNKILKTVLNKTMTTPVQKSENPIPSLWSLSNKSVLPGNVQRNMVFMGQPTDYARRAEVMGFTYKDRYETEKPTNDTEKPKSILDKVKEKQNEIMQQIDNIESYLSSDRTSQQEEAAKKLGLYDEIRRKLMTPGGMNRLKDSQTQTDDIPYIRADGMNSGERVTVGAILKEIEVEKPLKERQSVQTNNPVLKKHPLAGKIPEKVPAKTTEKPVQETEPVKRESSKGKIPSRGVASETEIPSFSKYKQHEKDSSKENIQNVERKTTEQDKSSIPRASSTAKSKTSKVKESEIPSFSKYQSKR